MEYRKASPISLIRKAFACQGEGAIVSRHEPCDSAMAFAIVNFGEPGEDIRAFRYIGSRAYTVTFKKMDPLYAFELSDPYRSQLFGKKKPGFSSYLHPRSENLLVVLGFE